MLIVVLGGGIDLKGNLPPFVFQRLDKAYELYKKNNKCKIVTSGKYSFLYKKEKPPITEAKAMKQYLLKKGIPPTDLLTESNSKDSIGNAYYLKKNIFIPRKEYKAIIITSHFHLERIRFVFNKVFGQKYQLSFIGVMEKAIKMEKEIIDHQKKLLNQTKKILLLMKTGDHEFLKEKLYKIDFYQKKRPEWVVNFVAQGH